MELLNRSSKKSEAKNDIYDDNDKADKPLNKKQFCLENFEEFSSCTSLHGFQYLSKRSFCERSWWLIMITMSVVMCGCFIQKTWTKWNETPVIVSFAETATPIWQIPFPAITVCPTTRIIKTRYNVSAILADIRKKNWENLTEQEFFEAEAIQQFCPLGRYLNDFVNESHVNFLRNLSELYTDVLVWKGHELHRVNSWVPITTDNGFCKTFNGLDSTEIFKNITPHFDEYDIEKRFLSNGWTLENGYPRNLTGDTYPRRTSSSMIEGGFRGTLVMFENEINYMCSFTEKGFKVTIHSPSDFPMTSHEYFLAPVDQEILISVKPNIITTSPGLASYDPERRKCYMPEEKTLKYFKIYSVRNCEWECLSNYTFQVCGCVRYWMPRERDMPICAFNKVGCTMNASIDLQELGMKYEYAKSIGDTDGIENLGEIVNQCNCMPSCTSLGYDVEITQNPQNLNSALEGMGESDPSLNGLYMTTLKIFFKESQFITSKRSELFGITDFLGNCGGILGLFLGFSLLSLVEIVYFLTIRPACNLRENRLIQ